MMACKRRVVAGIGLAAGRGTTEVALLELVDGEELPVFRPEARRAVASDDEILAALANARPEVIAIDAPLSLPAVVAAAVRHDVGSVGAFAERPPAPSGSPYTRQAERDPIWRELGLRPLPVSFLGGLTFRALVLAPKLRALAPESVVIEVFPTATLRVLGIRPRVEGRKREAKTGVIARMATQHGLARYIHGLWPDGEPLGADLLDALAAALTAVAYSRGLSQAFSDAGERRIVLPSVEFARWVIPAMNGRGTTAGG
jgi:predicted nuclease with RNAse H fold